jgi:hypothetical protein
MIVLKHIVSIARNDGRLPFNPFAGYINSPESVNRGYLTQKEIQTLMDALMKNTYHELVRDLFVFSVFTGLAYSDVKNLTACKHSSTATYGSSPDGRKPTPNRISVFWTFPNASSRSIGD